MLCQWSVWVSIQGFILLNSVVQDLGAGVEHSRSEFAEDAEVGGAVGSRNDGPCRGIQIGGTLGNHQWQQI